jgi:hypothetical protein
VEQWNIFNRNKEISLDRILSILFLFALTSASMRAETTASTPATSAAQSNPNQLSSNNNSTNSNNSTASTAAPTMSGMPSATPQMASVQTSPTGAPSLVQQLIQKLTMRDGKRAEIVVFSPIDESKNKVGKSVASQIVTAFRSYGPVNVRGEKDVLSNLTLEDFRLLMARNQADILIGLVTRDTHFNMYLYDRRSPYAVYAHSEQIPESARANLTEATASQYTRLLVRRLLFRYLNNQYFELPREESLPVLQSEIPKWVASDEALSSLNREYVSRFYGSMVVGAAISMGRSKQLWNANLVGIQLGMRVWDKWFLEGTATSAAYNSFTASMKYLFMNREYPFQLTAGLGFSFVTKDKVWILDQTIGLGRYSYYVTPSASVMWPIGDVYLKLETQIFFNLGFNQFMFTFMPGLSFYF